MPSVRPHPNVQLALLLHCSGGGGTTDAAASRQSDVGMPIVIYASPKQPNSRPAAVTLRAHILLSTDTGADTVNDSQLQVQVRGLPPRESTDPVLSGRPMEEDVGLSAALGDEPKAMDQGDGPYSWREFLEYCIGALVERSAAAMQLVTLEPARAASNTAAVRSASGEALAAMQRGTVVIKMPAVGALAAGAGALINHLPDELLAEVLCFVDAKTLFVAVPSVSLAGGHCVWIC